FLLQASIFRFSVMCQSSYTSFKRYSQQLLGFYRKFHWELVKNFFAIPVYDHIDRFFRANATLVAVKQNIFSNLGGGSFMFYNSTGIVYIEVGKGMCSAMIRHQQRITL